MNAVGKNFSLFDTAPGVLEIYFALSYGLYLRSEKLDAGFVGFKNEIIVIRFFILSRRLQAFFFIRRKITSFYNYLYIYYINITLTPAPKSSSL